MEKNLWINTTLLHQLLANRVWRFGFVTSRFGNFSIFGMNSDSVSKECDIKKRIGFGIKRMCYRKKHCIWYQNLLVLEKVSHSGWFFGWETSRSQNFPIFGWFRIQYREQTGIGKVPDLVSFRFWVPLHTSIFDNVSHDRKHFFKVSCGPFVVSSLWHPNSQRNSGKLLQPYSISLS